jgi:hypothetical protein
VVLASDANRYLGQLEALIEMLRDYGYGFDGISNY